VDTVETGPVAGHEPSGSDGTLAGVALRWVWARLRDPAVSSRRIAVVLRSIVVLTLLVGGASAALEWRQSASYGDPPLLALGFNLMFVLTVASAFVLAVVGCCVRGGSRRNNAIAALNCVMGLAWASLMGAIVLSEDSSAFDLGLLGALAVFATLAILMPPLRVTWHLLRRRHQPMSHALKWRLTGSLLTAVGVAVTVMLGLHWSDPNTGPFVSIFLFDISVLPVIVTLLPARLGLPWSRAVLAHGARNAIEKLGHEWLIAVTVQVLWAIGGTRTTPEHPMWQELVMASLAVQVTAIVLGLFTIRRVPSFVRRVVHARRLGRRSIGEEMSLELEAV
jgi:hypothetical protein